MMLTIKFSKLSWWQVVLLSVIVSAAGGLASGRPKKKERKLYNEELKQAPWAPPAWAFGPAWSINNLFILMALQQILKPNVRDKKTLLILQAGIWTIFFSFGYVYFSKKSSVLAALWTVGDAALAASSCIVAFKSNKKLAYYYLPLLAWTTFAGTIAVYQALENPDPVLHTNALFD